MSDSGITLYYMFFAVILQNNAPDVTYGYPYTTLALCEAAMPAAAALLDGELKIAAPRNAGSYRVWCTPVEMPAIVHPKAPVRRDRGI